MYKSIHCGVSSDSQTLQKCKCLPLDHLGIFINKRTDTPVEVYPYSGILPSNEKEQIMNICRSRDESQKYYIMQKKRPDTKEDTHGITPFM